VEQLALCWRALWRANDIKGSLKDSSLMDGARLFLQMKHMTTDKATGDVA